MRRRKGLAGSPFLVGFVTLVIIFVGVYVSYTATSGLPFQPKYTFDIQVHSGAQLFKGADVTIAGNRVGRVNSIKPAINPSGKTYAVLNVTLDKQYQPLPSDTQSLIRVSGTLGSKYLQLTPGSASTGVPNGGTLALANNNPPVVEIDELLNMFRKPVQEGIKGGLDGFGTGFAGRGEDLNTAIAKFVPLLDNLEPVMTTLADPSTQFGRLWRSFERLGTELAPVSSELAGTFRGLDTTFGALARVAPSIGQTIVESPPTEDAAIRAFAKTGPLLRETTALFAALRPGVAVLPRTAPPLADAFEAGTRTLPKVPALAGRLTSATQALATFSQNTTVEDALDRIALTGTSLKDPLNFLTPVQTKCNYAALFTRNLASSFGDSISTGTTVRVTGIVVGVAKNAERGPSNAPFNGAVAKALGPVHSNPYPNTFSPGQTGECEAGSEPYIVDRPVIGNVPGVQRTNTEEASLP